MIQKSVVLLFLVFTFETGCVYEVTPEPTYVSTNCGSVTALVNGADWPGISADAAWTANGRLDLGLNADGIEGWLDGYLGIQNVQPFIRDTQRIFPWKSSSSDTTTVFYMIANGDAVYGLYKLAEEDTNAIVILDSITKEKIWGRVDNLVLISFFGSPPYGPSLPDTIRFTTGGFVACVRR